MITEYNMLYLLSTCFYYEIDSEKKLEIYEFLSEQKLTKKKKRLESRRK
jgi:CMP-N-acetylneuraminic acid synthetase